MKKYEPKYVYNELAIQGWESAALFAQGVKAAGNDLTWANVIKKTNAITSLHGRWPDDAGQLGRRRSQWPRPAVLRRLRRRQGHAVRPILNKGQNVFNCFHSSSTKANPVFPVPAGTPAPH